MSKKKLVPASLASQKRHEAPEDIAREAELHISKSTADLTVGLLEILAKSIWRIRQGLCAKNPGVGINGCWYCQEGLDEKPGPVDLNCPPHRHQFKAWVHRAFEVIERAINGQQEEVFG